MKITDLKNDRKQRPLSMIQFGEGNFLRAFVDYMVDISNEKGLTDIGVAIIKPIPMGSLESFIAQQGLYNVLLRGKINGEVAEDIRLVTCVQQYMDCYADYENYITLAGEEGLRFIVSNTTDAGIVYDETDNYHATPPNTFPGKLTQFLFERFKTFDGDAGKGVFIIPVELIEENGKKLKECVLKFCDLWQLPQAFVEWLNQHCCFCTTLVDRIVSGFPKEDAPEIWKKLGYEDKLLVSGEPFALFVIEPEKSEMSLEKELPLHKAGLPVVFTADHRPYRERKVRILNGAHTSMIMAAYLSGLDIVSECMKDAVIRKYMEYLLHDEVIPTIDLPEKEIQDFAASVVERFENPFIRHELMSIALNSTSKWKSRILPTLLDNYKKNAVLPKLLTFSFAAMLTFYRNGRIENGAMVTSNFGREYKIQDDMSALEAFVENSSKSTEEYVRVMSSKSEIWGMDLTTLDGFTQLVARYMEDMTTMGVKGAISAI